MDTILDSLLPTNAFLDDITTITKSTLEKHEEETERNIKTTRQKNLAISLHKNELGLIRTRNILVRIQNEFGRNYTN